MRSIRRRYGMSLALLLPVVVAAGCTGSDVLRSSTGNVHIEIQLVNSDTVFETSLFAVTQVAVRPVDTESSMALGNLDIGLLPEEKLVTYREEFDGSSSVPLQRGFYKLKNILIGFIQFVDAQGPISTRTCEEYVRSYFYASGTGLALTDFGGDVILDIQGEIDTEITIVIDGEAFFNAFVDAWTCRQNCIFQNPFRIEPWCIDPAPVAFDDDQFAAAAPGFIDVQVQ